ncbi:S46 family peptidase [Flammeovirga pectinis]|uniref:Dipeptidyl-peptidase n=1 Tax=Flammeovirga pectinis TaxID=2494373 RepID=A0A3S9P4G3_9BACT|nr:S46 family peptidase [Flammeovirga pectinis]AZQ63038.1 S46 family peptidase [Flammeovirga pectinis]
MKKFLHIVLISFVLTPFSVFAHEGMWLPSLLQQLNEEDMQANGFKLTAEDIYSVNKSSMKDAVVWFGRGCTGEVVSDKGLILTNHHCGYGQIQSHSTVENDLLTNGFAAQSFGEELKSNGLTVSFVVRIEDVSKAILDGVTDDLKEEERQKIIKENIAKVGDNAIKDTHYEYIIKPFFYGNEYYMFVMETFTDIRLVFAPPSSIGKFGGDTDNWMWPRHTGDFSIFRIYADKDGKPAEYSEDNIPYKPKYHFPITLNGVKPNDFTMVYGFPGRTKQYLPSEGIEYTVDKSNPIKIAMREKTIAIYDKNMAADDNVRIKYSAKKARVANAYKKWIGESKGLKRLDAIDKKVEQEKMFADAVKNKPEYASLLADFKQEFKEIEKYQLARDLYVEELYYGPEILRFALGFEKLNNANAGNPETMKTIAKLKNSTNSFFKNYDKATDQEVFVSASTLYSEAIDSSFLPSAFSKAKDKDAFNKLAATVYKKSIFCNQDKLDALLNGPEDAIYSKIVKDPAFIIAKEIHDTFTIKVQPEYSKLSESIDLSMRTYVKALQEVFPNREYVANVKGASKQYWSDANSTLRVTYGKIEGSEPRDGVDFKYYTTLEGVMEKRLVDVPNTHEFYVPKKLIDLYKDKDYGQYAEDGKMVVCITGSNHTTGGNSGSPVINAEGQLIGINFDRTWESTMSDLMFDPVKCRNIIVDIRYVLFVVDKYGECSRLIDEMTIVKN